MNCYGCDSKEDIKPVNVGELEFFFCPQCKESFRKTIGYLPVRDRNILISIMKKLRNGGKN